MIIEKKPLNMSYLDAYQQSQSPNFNSSVLSYSDVKMSRQNKLSIKPSIMSSCKNFTMMFNNSSLDTKKEVTLGRYHSMDPEKTDDTEVI